MHKLSKILSTAAGAGLTLSSIIGCQTNREANIYRLENHPTFNCENPEFYSIWTGTNVLIDIPFSDHWDPVHQFISISKEKDGETVFLYDFHGSSIGRKSGKELLGNNSSVLHFTITNWEEILKPYKHITSPTTLTPEKRSSEIFSEISRGTAEEILIKAIAIVDLGCHLNRQNLVYDKFEWDGGEGQNSNSFFRAFLDMLGEDLPERQSGFWAPGFERHLISDQWKSYYENWTPPDQSTEFLQWYLNAMIIKAEIEVGYNNKTEIFAPRPRPPFSREKFLDPENPFVEYEPLIIEDALEKWKASKVPRPLPSVEINIGPTPIS